MKSVSNMAYSDIMVDDKGDDDPLFMGKIYDEDIAWDPHDRLPDEGKNDPNLPSEFRKVLNVIEPESQYPDRPAVD